MYARSLKGSIAPKGQQNIAQGIALSNESPPQSFPEREADNCRNSNTSKN